MLDTSKIDAILNEFLIPFEAAAVAGDDFYYLYARSTIQYAFATSARMDKLFLENAIKLGLKVKVDTFLLAFLHELGHHMTLDELEDEECNYSRDVKDTLGTTDEDCIIYYNLPDEQAATLWAIDFLNNRTEEVRNLWAKLQPAILNFYKENGVM